jgi:Zn-dependent protease
MGNFTALGVRFAVYLLLGIAAGMIVREYARAFVASKLGDPTPRLWGRLTLRPSAWFDPFGSGLLAILVALLWAAGQHPPPFAYAKPAPIDPNYFKRRTRDTVLCSVAGPIGNVVVALIAGIPIRVGIGDETALFFAAIMLANLSLAVFHLLPVPGLDGARLVGLLLPPPAARAYRNFDQYLPLSILVLMFIVSGPINSIVYSFVNALCRVSAGISCVGS